MNRDEAEVFLSSKGSRDIPTYLSMLGTFKEGKDSNLYDSIGYRCSSYHSNLSFFILIKGLFFLLLLEREEGREAGREILI